MAGSLVVSRLGRFGRTIVGATRATVPAGAFGARFAEVRVDPELGLMRIARIVSATDAGRVVNEKLARSQIIGGTVGGIGMPQSALPSRYEHVPPTAGVWYSKPERGTDERDA